MDTDALIDQTAAAVAPGYRRLDLSAAAGLLLAARYEGDVVQFAPLALELVEVDEHVDRDGEQRELGMPSVEQTPETFALCAALNERIGSSEDVDVLIESYWLALASHVHGLVGVPVLVHGVEMPIAEQLRRLGEAAPVGDALAELDVVVSVRVDQHQVAAVFARDRELYGVARIPDVALGLEWPVGLGVTELGRNPQILAGSMPRGAVAAALRDRAGVWHDAAVGPGVWLCVLPQRSGRKEPAVRYHDVAGNLVGVPEDDFSAGVPDEDESIDAVRADAERVLRGANVPALWPRQVSGRPSLFAWEGERDAATALGLAGGGSRVWIARSALDPRQVFRQHLIDDWGYEHETAGLRARQIPCSELPGSVNGEPVIFALAAPSETWMYDEGWVAVARGDGFAVTITRFDDPPDRLDLLPIVAPASVSS